MTADPRVEAVAEALSCYRADEPFTPAALAPIAVAALDAYDRETAPVSRDHKWLDFHHAAWEADLRERIAQEIEAAHRTAPDRAVIAEAAIARVRARHVKALGTDACEECSSWSLYRKVVPWPCATIRALDGEA